MKENDIKYNEPCLWCGKFYNEHISHMPINAPIPRMGCGGLKDRYYSKRMKNDQDNK